MNPIRHAALWAWASSCLFAATFELAAQNSFTRGPFVQNAASNSIQIIWRTANPSSSCITYGLTSSREMAITNSLLGTNHVVTMTDLAPATTYLYEVWTENGTGGLYTAPETFRTLKTEGPISFEVISDTAGAAAVTTTLVARMLESNPDLVVHCGDIATGSFSQPINDATYGTQFFSIFLPHIRTTPYYLIPGNHDISASFGGDPSGTVFQNAFYLPTNSATGSKLFYSFDHGDVHFVCLYNPWFANYVFTVGDTQYNWLTNDLATTTKPWKLLFSHFPIATASQHATDNYNGNSTYDQYEVMALLAPVAQQYGVDLYFSGHDHAFQRFAPTNGMHYVVNGSGGQGPYNYRQMHAALEQFWSGYAFLRVNITNDTLFLEAVNTNGVVFDRMTVQKALPPRQIYQASWHTVTMTNGPANDGDGNITNQWFDFIGAPIFPRAGQFSNLGQVFVNNDSTNLYIGFTQVMIYGNHNVFLFLDSPRLAGVSSMAGLGNGVIDPAGQGADGLDCLENLSFASFSPSVGCILGDEYADGQFRNFARANLALNIGQGIYRLDQDLTDLPGASLQQFNRSPQSGSIGSPINLEQNADLIVLAIPFSSLGGLQPWESIKLGAVVGGAAYDATAQTRQLDTSVLGYSLIGSGQDSVLLEGVTVQLATDPNNPPIRVAVTTLAPNQCQLTWNAVVGSAYDIEYSTTITNFVHLHTQTAGATNETYSFTPTAETGFYRIKKL